MTPLDTAGLFYENSGFQSTARPKDDGADGGPAFTEIELIRAIGHRR